MADSLIELQQEVLRKIGRNVLLFQHVEGLLRVLLVDSHISGYMSEIRAKHARRQASIDKQTMGQVLRQYLDIPQLNTQSSSEPTELKEAWISFTVAFEDDQGSRRLQESLSELVAERNDLIHHFFSQWNLHSVEDSQRVQAHLDRQRDKIVQQAQQLEERIRDLQAIKRDVADTLSNPDFLQQLLEQK